MGREAAVYDDAVVVVVLGLVRQRFVGRFAHENPRLLLVEGRLLPVAREGEPLAHAMVDAAEALGQMAKIGRLSPDEVEENKLVQQHVGPPRT